VYRRISVALVFWFLFLAVTPISVCRARPLCPVKSTSPSDGAAGVPPGQPITWQMATDGRNYRAVLGFLKRRCFLVRITDGDEEVVIEGSDPQFEVSLSPPSLMLLQPPLDRHRTYRVTLLLGPSRGRRHAPVFTCTHSFSTGCAIGEATRVRIECPTGPVPAGQETAIRVVVSDDYGNPAQNAYCSVRVLENGSIEGSAQWEPQEAQLEREDAGSLLIRVRDTEAETLTILVSSRDTRFGTQCHSEVSLRICPGTPAECQAAVGSPVREGEWWYVPVTISLTDTFGNPAEDGTQIAVSSPGNLLRTGPGGDLVERLLLETKAGSASFQVVTGTPVGTITLSVQTEGYLETLAISPDCDQPVVPAWTPVALGEGGPAPRLGMAMAADRRSGKLYVYGGCRGSLVFNDLWIYAPEDETWTRIMANGTWPKPLRFCSGAVCPYTGRFLVYGGLYDVSQRQRHLWAYSDAQGWELVSTAPWEYDRYRHAAVVDSRGRLLIFGGLDYYNQTSSDVLVFQLPEGPWYKLDVGQNASPGRTEAAVAYDPSRECLWVFGGRDVRGKLLGDLWQLRLHSGTTGTWVRIDDTEGGPAPRCGSVAFVDPTTGNLVIAGGWDGQGICAEMWIYSPDEDRWICRVLDHDHPLARAGAALAVVTEPTWHVYLFGGRREGNVVVGEPCKLIP